MAEGQGNTGFPYGGFYPNYRPQGTPSFSNPMYNYGQPFNSPQLQIDWQNSPSTSATPPTINDDEDNTSGDSSKRSYDKWTEEQEVFLLDLWSEYQDELESAQSRKYWNKIQERLNKRFKASWTLVQVQRKIRYLKEQYKKANDWNRKQTGGNRKTSPHFDKMNEVLGKKDSVTMKHIVSAGNSPTCSTTKDTSSPSTSNDSKEMDEDEEMKGKGKSAKDARKERKTKRRMSGRQDEELEDKKSAKVESTLDCLQQQGAKIADTMQSIVTSMQQNQTQQVQFMGDFMKIFASMAKQTQEKDKTD